MRNTRNLSTELLCSVAGAFAVLAATSASAAGAQTISASAADCTSLDQPLGGLLGSTAPLNKLILKAFAGQQLSAGYLKAFGITDLNSASTEQLVKMLMQANFAENGGPPSDDQDANKPPPLPKGATAGSTDNKLAASVYIALRQYVSDVVRTPDEFFVIDPNGLQKRQLGVLSDTNSKKTDWFLWRVAAGVNFQVACKYAPPPPDNIGWQILPVPSSNTIEFSGERDDLALAAFNIKDPLATTSTFNVSPGTSNSSGKSTYNVSVEGALGYTFASRNCDLDQKNGPTCQDPLSLTTFVDAYYGPDKNAPKTMGMTTSTVDRVGAGVDFAWRIDHPFITDDEGSLLIQAIPEYITDSHFASEAFYGELRADVIDLPFTSVCTANGSLPIADWGTQINCGFAVIGDYAHTFDESSASTLFRNTFARLGGQIGVGIAPDTDLCGNIFCEVIGRTTASAWYKALGDVSGHHASAYNFTAQLSFNLTGESNSPNSKGLALTVKYTDGVEDITLYKLPTWSVGFSTSM